MYRKLGQLAFLFNATRSMIPEKGYNFSQAV